MLKPKHVAPIFSMSPIKLSEILRELNLVYPLSQTPMGSFLIRDSDLPMIEMYNKTLILFNNKKMALQHVKNYIEKTDNDKFSHPVWVNLIKKQKSG